jgi:hypothetical protein
MSGITTELERPACIGSTTERSYTDHARSHSPSIDITYTSPSGGSLDLSRIPTAERGDALHGLARTLSRGHMGEALENLANARSNASQDLQLEDTLELRPIASIRRSKSTVRPAPATSEGAIDGLSHELGTPAHPITQGIPPELGSLTKEILFIMVCSSGQLLFAFFQGNVNVPQTAYQEALGIRSTQLPWLVGSFLVALGLSVVVSGSLTDLVPPKPVVVVAFVSRHINQCGWWLCTKFTMFIYRLG